MIGNLLRVLALAAVPAFLFSAPPLAAAPYDGNWNMIAVTTNGHCGKIKIGLAISGNRISSTSGKFAFHRIHLVGRIYGSGQAKMRAVAGPRKAEGVGRFNRSRGVGTWSGTGTSGLCSGFWNATRV